MRIKVNGRTYQSTDDLRRHLREQLDVPRRPHLQEPSIPVPEDDDFPSDPPPSRPADAPASGQVLLNGVPIDLDAPERKRWWRH